MKHIHCDLIKAWADGAQIQVFSGDEWKDVDRPFWSYTKMYRVKPKVIKGRFRACLMRHPKDTDPEGGWISMATVDDKDDYYFVRWIDPEWREIEVEV